MVSQLRASTKAGELKPTSHLRVACGGIFLLVAWHSIGALQQGRWYTRTLQSNLRATADSVLDESWTGDLKAEMPVHCFNSTLCCGVWGVNADNWWTHMPTWEVVSEDEKSFCFSPMKNESKIAFLKEVHLLQWNIGIPEARDLSLPVPETNNFTVNCSNIIGGVNIDSGYGASRTFLLWAFWAAFTQHKPFQTIQKWNWNYAMSSERSNWINCTVHDQSCFYLPISPCSREDKDWPVHRAFPDKSNETQMMQTRWLQEYMTRPNQHLRKAVHTLRLPLEEKLLGGCVGMHVRRADVAAPQPPYRRYAAVQEYLDMVQNLQANSTIFLLTDDATTIDEVNQYHALKYNWVYSNKTRVRGVEQGFNRHVPSASSGPDELAWLTVELDLVSSYCDTFVYGKSGIAYAALELAKAKGRAMEKHEIRTEVAEAEATAYRGQPFEREAHLLQQVYDRYAQQ